MATFMSETLILSRLFQGSSKVLKITPNGQITVAASGLTTVLGVAFDQKDRMYVLENTTGQGTLSQRQGPGKWYELVSLAMPV